jgi:hypothetical protein
MQDDVRTNVRRQKVYEGLNTFAIGGPAKAGTLEKDSRKQMQHRAAGHFIGSHCTAPHS